MVFDDFSQALLPLLLLHSLLRDLFSWYLLLHSSKAFLACESFVTYKNAFAYFWSYLLCAHFVSPSLKKQLPWHLLCSVFWVIFGLWVLKLFRGSLEGRYALGVRLMDSKDNLVMGKLWAWEEVQEEVWFCLWLQLYNPGEVVISLRALFHKIEVIILLRGHFLT